MVNNLFKKINLNFAIYLCMILSGMILFLFILELLEVIPFGVAWIGKEPIQNGDFLENLMENRDCRIIRSYIVSINIFVFGDSLLCSDFLKKFKFSKNLKYRSGLLATMVIICTYSYVLISLFIDKNILFTITINIHLVILLIFIICLYRILLNYPRVKGNRDFIETNISQ